MSCILRVNGQYLDVDNLVKKISIKPYDIYKKDEPIIKNLPKTRKLKHSGIAFDVSKAGFDQLDQQIKDCIKFLSKNKSDLQKITNHKNVDYAVLDFGVGLLIGTNNIGFQSDVLPSALLKAAGNLGLDISISLYPMDRVKMKKKLPLK